LFRGSAPVNGSPLSPFRNHMRPGIIYANPSQKLSLVCGWFVVSFSPLLLAELNSILKTPPLFSRQPPRMDVLCDCFVFPALGRGRRTRTVLLGGCASARGDSPPFQSSPSPQHPLISTKTDDSNLTTIAVPITSSPLPRPTSSFFLCLNNL